MKTLLWLIFLLLIGAPRIGALAQSDDRPITRDELIKLIKESGPRPRLSQSDIAGEVARRGVSLTLDDKTVDELKQAGAQTFLIESIRHSIEDAATPKEAHGGGRPGPAPTP
jgi:hypothetical protein